MNKKFLTLYVWAIVHFDSSYALMTGANANSMMKKEKTLPNKNTDSRAMVYHGPTLGASVGVDC